MKLSRILVPLMFSMSLSQTACMKTAPTASQQNTPEVFSTQAQEEEEDCQVAQSGSRQFLPKTQMPPFGRILPAHENDCGFYNWAWQTFLFSTKADSQNRPDFIHYPALEQVFQIAAGDTGPTDLPLLNGGVKQAGDHAAVLVDQNRNPVVYSIHTNAVFAEFVRSHDLYNWQKMLKTPEQGGISSELEFPPGSVEYKAAWRILEPGEIAPDYFTMRARIPVLKNKGKSVDTTAQTREVTVALLSLHVVGVVEDHPEFIWATFEHADSDGRLDLVPTALENPVAGQIQKLASPHPAYPLFGHGATAVEGNQLPPVQNIDESTQKFTAPTPIFRVYPASFSDSAEADAGLESLNENMGKLFAQTDPQAQDLRRHYRLVGAVWLDNPESKNPQGVFKANRNFENKPGETILAGEDNLASMAMESFAQTPAMNCLSCHNTTPKYIQGQQVFPARKINVSNVMSYMAQQDLKPAH
ncbi:hypothetical protein COW36_19655 [bacterium (Candidatus Blackallbacteria) CG17_big_fil_post_rev_8_21_14_2_50_48_46]|uniref:Cytochrome c family protein n=1 Tax=bacterium (Candidatus Blackallbacteria) CG17_big_fil_post_rev_8_21_14_2_50_48_46 TaxID=2014261 RepID=A0A2M7FZT3_9BACT|nr:MAG: hypothetical protein COW64_15640 [bacterium (Candidatus Blackallbacteria) CG18_big_fil_WC_8_21_14_2_50_49_26]PIW14869.1 MAG: hypothetical protein COW36_19655 [bacterium (Candidatus Blackallbacteria) CG17_big_fil_post_rev_8_21_14_2_50_48_46]PIW44436.1 MAG: hypothetical protein COW20_24230 [bacterium (Candidatus Blackallbacteria) CG13_big_fil_rev_8_21_14_2_50_49_14]